MLPRGVPAARPFTRTINFTAQSPEPSTVCSVARDLATVSGLRTKKRACWPKRKTLPASRPLWMPDPRESGSSDTLVLVLLHYRVRHAISTQVIEPLWNCRNRLASHKKKRSGIAGRGRIARGTVVAPHRPSDQAFLPIACHAITVARRLRDSAARRHRRSAGCPGSPAGKSSHRASCKKAPSESHTPGNASRSSRRSAGARTECSRVWEALCPACHRIPRRDLYTQSNRRHG